MKTFILPLLILLFGTSFTSGNGDELQVNPDEEYGVVTISVADARLGTDFDMEMGTQFLPGMPVKILQHQGWWQVKGAVNRRER